VAAHDSPNFDPRVIERFAESAYRKANAIFTGCVAGGVVLDVAFGATPLTPLGESWPIPPGVRVRDDAGGRPARLRRR